MKAYCRDQITHFKIPRHIRFVTEYPMTVTGKIQKFVMRDEMLRLWAAESQLGLSTSDGTFNREKPTIASHQRWHQKEGTPKPHPAHTACFLNDIDRAGDLNDRYFRSYSAARSISGCHAAEEPLHLIARPVPERLGFQVSPPHKKAPCILKVRFPLEGFAHWSRSRAFEHPVWVLCIGICASAVSRTV